MKLHVAKSRLEGQVRAPASKSHTIRAVLVASLAAGESILRSPLQAADTLSAIECYRSLGAEIITEKSLWRVRGTAGRPRPLKPVIDVGNSGTTLRLGMGSAALMAAGEAVTFTGDRQVQSRPVGPLCRCLVELGAGCRYLATDETAPLEVSGRLRGGSVGLEAATSQYLSSLLMAAPLAEGETIIEVSLLNEPGYVKMTLDWLNEQSIKYSSRGLESFTVPGGQGYRPFDREIPGDFSSATFLLCAAAIAGGEVTVSGLDLADSQPDREVIGYLRQMGASIHLDGPAGAVTVSGSTLSGVEIDMNGTPDALCAMAVTAAFAGGKTSLVNVPQARTKETDRIRCTTEELRKMGINVEELADGLVIHGGRPRAAVIDGRGDHRLVMAFAIAGLAAAGETTVLGAEAMEVTFPAFTGLMRELGADMRSEL
jgi:3-phosphoshikimate 1-carboxyvinyltransferase